MYRETQDSLFLIRGGGGGGGGPSPSLTRKDLESLPGSPRHAVANTMSPRMLETCLAVLQRLPDEEGALDLFLRHTNPNDGWIRGAARRVVESLTQTFKRELRARRAADLERMALLISANTARPWVDNELDSEKWLASFSGPNLRWESLGILFTYCTSPFVSLLWEAQHLCPCYVICRPAFVSPSLPLYLRGRVLSAVANRVNVRGAGCT